MKRGTKWCDGVGFHKALPCLRRMRWGCLAPSLQGTCVNGIRQGLPDARCRGSSLAFLCREPRPPSLTLTHFVADASDGSRDSEEEDALDEMLASDEEEEEEDSDADGEGSRPGSDEEREGSEESGSEGAGPLSSDEEDADFVHRPDHVVAAGALEPEDAAGAQLRLSTHEKQMAKVRACGVGVRWGCERGADLVCLAAFGEVLAFAGGETNEGIGRSRSPQGSSLPFCGRQPPFTLHTRTQHPLPFSWHADGDAD